MSQSRAERQLIGALGGFVAASRVDTVARARKAQEGLRQRFRDQVLAEQPHLTDPADIERRAESLRKAHFVRLALASRRARLQRTTTDTGNNAA